MTNRIGDFGFLMALLYIMANFRVSHFNLIYLQIVSSQQHGTLPEALPAIGALLIWAACAKSAQFPLYFWLPDAMEGPTPTSALMHAATMVTAGVFLLVRSWPLIAAVPGLPEVVAGIGCLTAVAAAIIAATKKDLKRILAYSTVSHLGLMMLALGLGQIGLAIFHLIVHGFFKAVLFLSAGNIGHAIHQPTANVDDVGGWRKALPWTYACFIVASLSLSGVWPLGGFFSKDAILEVAWEHGGWIRWVSPLIAFGSAFYISRMILLTFHGQRPEQQGLEAHPHEAPFSLIIPICFLTFGAAIIGFFAPTIERMVMSGWWHLPSGLPGLKGVLDLPGEVEIPVLGLHHMFGRGGLMALLGFVAAWRLTMSNQSFDWRWREHYPALEAIFESDFGWKTLMGKIADAVALGARWTGQILDKKWWDGAIESSSGAAQGAAEVLATYAQGRLNDSMWWMTAAVALILGTVLGVIR
jgi:NADH:ubiquinone oxidoreductase subunit 5 (subunit L)/multisubunit Na+/H+ antiporter MnhA subunit